MAFLLNENLPVRNLGQSARQTFCRSALSGEKLLIRRFHLDKLNITPSRKGSHHNKIGAIVGTKGKFRYGYFPKGTTVRACGRIQAFSFRLSHSKTARSVVAELLSFSSAGAKRITRC
jgi:hypothetical protein